MSPTELERYLHEHIPLSRSMKVSVHSIEPDSIILRAPLAPNINHRETVFGGSASALAILAAWSLLHTRLRREGLYSRLVIQRNSMEYDRPILGEFSARSGWLAVDDWDRFVRMLQRRGRARIRVLATLLYNGNQVGRMLGDFVAMDTTRDT